jgi:enoyl-[acyl-carrier protein] reductase I
MGLFDGKTALVTGVANRGSIAWGIAQALRDEGARLGFSYAHAGLESRVRPLAESAGAELIEECDVRDDAALDHLFERTAAVFGTLDVVVHAIAFAPADELAGRFSETSREGFHVALDVSTYSLIALAQRAAPLMPAGGAILTLTAVGGSTVLPHYNVMGVAKAALEAAVRYLADDLGPQGIRVNALSPGAVKTLAAASVPGFRDAYRETARTTPLRTNVTQDDVGRTALWLCSDWARAVTGEIVYVDAGYHILGATNRPDDGGASPAPEAPPG